MSGLTSQGAGGSTPAPLPDAPALPLWGCIFVAGTKTASGSVTAITNAIWVSMTDAFLAAALDETDLGYTVERNTNESFEIRSQYAVGGAWPYYQPSVNNDRIVVPIWYFRSATKPGPQDLKPFDDWVFPAATGLRERLRRVLRWR